MEEWLNLLLNSILDLTGLLVEGSVGGDNTAEIMDGSRQTVRNVLEAALNLRWELVGAGLDLLEFGKHGVTELVNLGLGDYIGGRSGLDDLVGGNRGPVSGD